METYSGKMFQELGNCAIPKGPALPKPKNSKTGNNSGKTFDELYNEFAEDLKQSGKSIDLCEKLKSCTSDFNRIQTVFTYSPSIVQTFCNSIGECYDGKDENKGKELFSQALSVTGNKNSMSADSESINDTAIELLNNALLLIPFQLIDSNSILEKWLDKDKLLHVEWFLALRVVEDENYGSECRSLNSCDGDHNDNADRIQEQENVKKVELDQKEDGNEQLVAKIYLERARRFNYKGDHESCILDIFTAIYFGLRKTFELVYFLGLNYKCLGHLIQAHLIFQHSIEILRDSSLWNNQRKSEETVRIVRQLKEIKSMIRTAEGKDIKEKITKGATTTGREEVKVVEEETTAFPSRNVTKTNLYFGRNSTLIAASESVELRRSDELGRHLIAKKTIPAGSTLILEMPYSWSLYPKMYRTFCQHCCRKTTIWIPCQRCSAIVFCSWKCSRETEHIHKFECTILKLLNSSAALGEMGLLCYRTMTMTSLLTLDQFLSQLESHQRQFREKKVEKGYLEVDGDEVTCSNKNQNEMMGEKRNLLVEKQTQLVNDEEEEMEISIIEQLLSSNAEKLLLDPAKYISTFAQSTNSKARPSGDILKRVLVSIYFTLCLRFTGFFDYHQFSSWKCHSVACAESHSHSSSSSSPSLPSPSPSPPKLNSNNKAVGGERVVQVGTGADANVNNFNMIKSEKSLMEMSRIELGVCSLLLRHLQSTSCNAYGMNTVDISSLPSIEFMEFGGATYPTISITNHSCNPNVYRYQLDGKLCAVKALLDIGQGEQILDCYGWNYLTSSREQRQAHLSSNYFFKCQCQPCMENWPLYGKLQEVKGTTTKPKPCSHSSGTSGKGKKKTCSKCQRVLKEMTELETKCRAYRKILRETKEKENLRKLLITNYEAMESTFSRYISVLQNLFQLPEKRVVECQETLKFLWNLSASLNI